MGIWLFDGDPDEVDLNGLAGCRPMDVWRVRELLTRPRPGIEVAVSGSMTIWYGPGRCGLWLDMHGVEREAGTVRALAGELLGGGEMPWEERYAALTGMIGAWSPSPTSWA